MNEEAGKPEQACLSCICKHPVAFKGDVITTKIRTLDSHVFSYDLDMFDGEAAPAYSATNPSDSRFDVVCFKGKNVADRVFIHGTATSDHSWYPPHLWRFVYCLKCKQRLLGWAFYKLDSSSQSMSMTPEFLGLIVTKLRPEKATLPDVTELQSMRKEFARLLEQQSQANELVGQQQDEEEENDESDEEDASEDQDTTNRSETPHSEGNNQDEIEADV
mmetsp:Transcript_15212/g.17227  ORF Transcript_15212/g.17227 Transcript_15212/m.17227 type:complete len:218 (+) Transcript_15212:175-828(+)